MLETEPARGASPASSTQGKILIVVSEDWYFLSHRFELAQFLRAAGWEVLIVTQINRAEDAAKIRNAGLRLVPLALERGRLLAPRDLVYLWRLIRLYQTERPVVVHHVAMKPILFGSLAALFVPRTGVVSALAGLGYLFTSPRGRVRVVRAMVLRVFRHLFARERTRVILQNGEDLAYFRDRLGVPAENLRLIRGAGIDLARFRVVVHGRRERPVAVMVSRMLRDKGVLELVAAGRRLQKEGIAVRIQLVGGVDEKNPNSLTREEIQTLHDEGVVEWLGHQADISGIYAAADIAVLPSYREGLPQSLLEAAAAGLPIVATDTSGCREVVTEGLNGLLVPVRDPERLAAALRTLILDPAARARMGKASRLRAEHEFRHELILQQTSDVYREVARD